MSQPGLPGSQFPGEDAQSRRIKELERQVQQFSAANVLATAGIGVIPNGILVNGMMQFKRADSTLGVQVDPADGTFVAFNAAGTSPVARFGSLVETSPGAYGVEVLVGATWVQVGAQATTWATVSGKPTDFAPLVTSAVANATTAVNASEATHAGQSDGSQYGWTNNVGGTEYYAVYVGNNGGFKFGRNVSSILYKENVRAHSNDPAEILKLRPVLYDRKATYPPVLTADGLPAEGPQQMVPGRKNEYGLIAEQVAEHAPELISWFTGHIDSVRYELLAVKHQDVLLNHENRIRALEGRPPLDIPANPFPTVPAPGAPDSPPAPLPYTINE
ncbi:tail fiber domain-containing protein [Arthrobacter sp. PsM3]|uniref:tail fiber domain-containing protein n=1 Tax=Arthrobacter sp. PsM3 TaxID=3030531 RepID=UPI00263A5229|nr:tail fiber domain-containing protein [Arthrobacter sp. PsM3]MDN4646458.1 tail fiber domain-containing protein [Arthrobacter sp. PsM3]